MLYKLTKKGQLQKWTITVVNDGYYTEEGINKMSKSLITKCYGKNIGKKNETTPEQQAILEAKAKRDKKIKEGYSETIPTTVVKEYMSAIDYEPFQFDYCYIQPKIDGVRCINSDKLMSKKGNEFTSVPHIKTGFDYVLDGELYCHEIPFEDVISIVKKTTKVDKNHELIKYYVFDLILDEPFSKRLEILNSLDLPDNFIKVPTFKVTSQLQLDVYHNLFLEQGYEGSMIRLDKPYDFKRSKWLMKRKDWKDSEYEVVDVIEGVGNLTGMIGKLVLKNGTETFDAPLNISHEKSKKLFLEKDKLIGKFVTVKYFELTKTNTPRFPKATSFRDYE